MNEEARARALARRWQATHPDLEGLQPHVVKFAAYWWASFRPGADDPPMLGGVSLLIDLDRGFVVPGPASVSPDRRIEDYESSRREPGSPT